VSEPLAYFITFTTYGTWLHGRAPGAVDRQHNVPNTPLLPPNAAQEKARRERMRQTEYVLDKARREVVLRTVLEVAQHRQWKVWAVHVRSNHVHVVVSAPVKPEKVMSDFKAWASRRLREAFGEDADRDRWTQHGSTRYLWDETTTAAKIAYVLDEQGEPMAHFDGRSTSSEPEA
jgi:REP element-mobilizing transposase RayT